MYLLDPSMKDHFCPINPNHKYILWHTPHCSNSLSNKLMFHLYSHMHLFGWYTFYIRQSKIYNIALCKREQKKWRLVVLSALRKHKMTVSEIRARLYKEVSIAETWIYGYIKSLWKSHNNTFHNHRILIIILNACNI